MNDDELFERESLEVELKNAVQNEFKKISKEKFYKEVLSKISPIESYQVDFYSKFAIKRKYPQRKILVLLSASNKVETFSLDTDTELILERAVAYNKLGQYYRYKIIE